MWLNSLDLEAQRVLKEAFISDGFKVRMPDESTLIAEKGGMKVVLDRLDSAHIVFDLKKYLKKHALLSTAVGGIEFNSLFKFLQAEKGFTESYLDCLSRIAVKFNWSAINTGQEVLEGDISTLLGHEIKYAEIETDSGEFVTLLAFKKHRQEKLYAANCRFKEVFNVLRQYSRQDLFQQLAPKAFAVVQKFIV